MGQLNQQMDTNSNVKKDKDQNKTLLLFKEARSYFDYKICTVVRVPFVHPHIMD